MDARVRTSFPLATGDRARIHHTEGWQSGRMRVAVNHVLTARGFESLTLNVSSRIRAAPTASRSGLRQAGSVLEHTPVRSMVGWLCGVAQSVERRLVNGGCGFDPCSREQTLGVGK